MNAKQYGKLAWKVASNFWSDVSTPAWLSNWNQLAAETGAELQLTDLELMLRKQDQHQSGKLSRASASDVSLLRTETKEIVTDLETLRRVTQLHQRVLDVLRAMGATPA